MQIVKRANGDIKYYLRLQKDKKQIKIRIKVIIFTVLTRKLVDMKHEIDKYKHVLYFWEKNH